MKTQNKTVVIYARVSTDKQKVDMQLNELRDFINRSGWKVYKEFIDEGFTGSTICYAFMQAVGMLNDHYVHCFRYHQVHKR
jgi:DNA invertase Pin-like site-specific DNA recombinase